MAKAGSKEDIEEIERQERRLRPLAGAEPKKKVKKKKGALKRLAKLMKMAIMGGRYPSGYKPPARFRKEAATKRTQQVSGALRQAGLTEEEIARLKK